MPRVTAVHPLAEFRLAVTFDDGVAGVVELKDRLFGPVFEPLKDPTVFQQVFVDDFGAVAWPNGADLAPDALHEQLRAASEIAVR
jgi:tRNA U34 5-methylaminomethyl-2-thiouridine-forming methyltransferase MnmC